MFNNDIDRKKYSETINKICKVYIKKKRKFHM